MSLLPNFRAWRITNTDTNQTVEGDFEATGISRTVQASYVRHKSLNQFKPITQFLSGNADTLSFQGRLYQHDAFDNITEKFNTLVAWVNRDPDLARPPIVLFSVGDADPAYFDGALAVIEGLSGITYDSPTVLGQVRGITFTVNLTEYTEYSLENVPAPETRYARAKSGDYMELLAYEEYKDPLIGDVIRKRHPEIHIVQANDVIRLPSYAAIQGTAVVPRSVPFKSFTTKKDTDQRALRDVHFDRTNRVYRSTILPRGV